MQTGIYSSNMYWQYGFSGEETGEKHAGKVKYTYKIAFRKIALHTFTTSPILMKIDFCTPRRYVTQCQDLYYVITSPPNSAECLKS